jgi:ligand-binding sensor domain-containing protein
MCLIFAPTVLLSQAYFTKNFNRDNGLPSNHIYSVSRDKSGLLWIATETGVCTFNGSRFNLNPIPELTNEEIVDLYLDRKNRLWFIGLNGNVSIYQDGQFSEFQNDKLSNQIRTITEDPLGNIWAKPIGDEFKDLAIDPDTLSIKYMLESKNEGIELLKKMKRVPINFPDRITLNNDTIIYQHLGAKIESKSLFQFFNQLTPLSSDTWMFRSNNRLFLYDVNTGELNPLLSEYNEEFDKGINEIIVDQNNNLWIAKNSGIMVVHNILEPQPDIRIYLSEVRILGCHADLNGNVWAFTKESGIYLISPKIVKTVNDSRNECATSIYKNKDYLIYGTLDGEIVILDHQLSEVKRIGLKNRQSKIYKIEEYSDNMILAVSSYNMELIDLTTFKCTDLLEYGFYKNATQDTFETIWINGGMYNYIYNKKIKDLTIITDLKERSYSCLPLNRNTALFGTVKGLYRVNKSNEVHKILGADFNTDVRHIGKGPDNTIILSTRADGLYIMKDEQLALHLYELLPSKNIRKTIYVDSIFWVASNNGLSQVLSEDQILYCKTIGQNQGLPSSSILDIYPYDDKIYCATEAGIGIVDKKIKFTKEVPILQIDKVKINERDTTVLDSYKLKKDQNNIKISFNSIFYSDPESVKFKYKLSGLDTDWTETDQTTVQYASLPAGQYKFLIRTKSLNSTWGSTRTIDFDIPLRFNETILYQLLRALLIAFAAIFVYNLRVKNKERQRALKISQLMALRTQMNPHFIFNSLNSVQDYILSDDSRAANKYISQFSKLMRYILNTSDQEFTALNLELDALQLYLSIESMRFDNTLIHKINVAPEVDPEKYQIPTMILQPFVENAIKHGLIHSKGEKSLIINVDKMEKGLYFEVIDNGIGRVHSQKINSTDLKKHNPKGTNLIQKRIELLNKGYKSENKVSFEDIYDQEGRPTGTKVKIILQSIKFKQ